MLGARTHVDLHSPVKSVVEEEVVCHADPVGFHRMALAVVVVPHITLGGKREESTLNIKAPIPFSLFLMTQDYDMLSFSLIYICLQERQDIRQMQYSLKANV